MIIASRSSHSAPRQEQGQPSLTKLANAVAKSLTDDLLKEPFRSMPRTSPLAGHCYVASEALYHLMGATESGLKPMNIKHEGVQHWFLKRAADGHPIDVTANQFTSPVPYDAAVGRGFLTRQPSRRAQVVIDRAQALLGVQLITPAS